MLLKKDDLFDCGKDLQKTLQKSKGYYWNFKMDNLKSDDGNDIWGLFQESYNPIGLHIDVVLIMMIIFINKL